MRWLLMFTLTLGTGCLAPVDDPPPDFGGGGWTGPTGDPISGCEATGCGSQVCARDGACYPASSIRAVHVMWTVNDAVASTVSCSAHPDLFIHFGVSSSFNESFGFAPVPCRGGKFTVDKLPIAYTKVELGVDGATGGTTASIDPVTGNATIDLP